MHPTADTLALKFLHWRGAAGAAGRSAASVIGKMSILEGKR
jgi:hypothetical protein